MNRLTFRYEYDASFLDRSLDRDDLGRLTMAVATEAFSGRGGFWVQWQDVKEFGELLNVYPVEPDAPLKAQWGYDMQQGDDLILSVAISAADPRGNLLVRVEIADEYEKSTRVRTSFLTNYPELEAFRADIARLMDREIEEAVLQGH